MPTPKGSKPRAISYSQVAEDLIAAYLLGGRGGKTYVDVGCLWPVQHSNTFLFYENGGHGLCIDANPDVAAEFKSERERDIFVNSGVWSEPANLTFYRFENPVFNTFDKHRAELVQATLKPGRRLSATQVICVRPLSDILEESKFLEATNGEVDLLSIDVEGAELQVLQGIRFQEFRPLVVIVETVKDKRPLAGSQLVTSMEQAGYELAAFTGHDAFFKRRKGSV